MSFTIVRILKEAEQLLGDANITDVPRLEADILLAHVLQVKRNFLYSDPDHHLSSIQAHHFFALLDRRLQGEPLAYLIGRREFWSLDLRVTPDVLIPRPETELVVELVLNHQKKERAIIADLGTGSGAIALAIAHERPHWIIHATDFNERALQVAKDNAKQLRLTNVFFHQGDWCAALPSLLFDVIVSNPPYIAKEDDHLEQPVLRFEPSSAFISGQEGLQDLKQIILGAKNYLVPGGQLILEHGFQQGDAVRKLLKASHYTKIITQTDLAGLERVTIAARKSIK